ncbi:hypothetical protein [Roseiconus lacunae]|uniref:hypothetical protein n=1 Tax=Roseiconus lacunae TaxID=2605694 RepID=UPI001E2A011C|nr:hypothetical protein [Roseiconus lacunae]
MLVRLDGAYRDVLAFDATHFGIERLDVMGTPQPLPPIPGPVPTAIRISIGVDSQEENDLTRDFVNQ